MLILASFFTVLSVVVATHDCSKPPVTIPCPYQCKPTCANPNPKNCKPNPLCYCKIGQVWSSSKGGKCIPISKCPKNGGCNGDKNAVIKQNVRSCLPTCDKPNVGICDKKLQTVGCVCKPGYILSKIGGKCIKPEQCSCGNPCGVNGTFVSCAFDCPSNVCPQTDSRGIILCKPPKDCPPGCACKSGYIRASPKDRKCIKPQDCKPVKCTRRNEVWYRCPGPCYSDSCNNVLQPNRICHAPKNPICRPQCLCAKGYGRNDKGECVPIEQCRTKYCNDKCKPTCANPNPKNCSVNPICNCKIGEVWSSSKNGKCIPINQCPKEIGCNGDKNAVIKQNVRSCVSTCDKPNVGVCDKKLLLVGCVCKPGYILSKIGGICIKPEQCSCGNPCGVNGTYVNCAFDCPSNVCPQTDSRGIALCLPPHDCPPGCVCKYGYIRAGPKDRRCIEPQECKPVKCTRQNEVWDRCGPDPCSTDSCEDVLKPKPVCNTLVKPICRPQCVCAKGYGRNHKDVCVPLDQCRTKYCNDKCKPTCANPNPKNCTQDPVCKCKIGEVWSNSKGGKCIPINQCPKDVGCNGDKNAVIKGNVRSCQPTCDKPDVVICDTKVQIVGCVCKPGYILSKISGKCVKPEQCPGGNPCGANGTYVNCAFDCPSNVCPQTDSRGIAVCDQPKICYPGCACKYGYIRAGPKDRRCIKPQECKPVKCTRQNEVWDRCGPAPCSTDSCEDVLKPKPVCNTLIKPICRPQCVCAKGYGRNDKDVCVPLDQCRTKYCNDKCKPTCANPNPKNCTQDPVCKCKIGEVWSNSKGGKCIPINQCPKDVGCNGDKNAVIKGNVRSCQPTCDKPDVVICDTKVQIVGCVCKPGYILSKISGKCVKPEQCPGGNPCGANGTYVNCAINCPSNVCPQTDSRAIVVCDPPKDCPPGCACKYGYIRAGPKDRRCIEPQNCAPVKCTRQNEIWNRCPSACSTDSCEDVLIPKPVCQTPAKPVCKPQCVCAKGYGRNDKDVCVPLDQCRTKYCNDKCKATCANPNPNCSQHPVCNCKHGEVWSNSKDGKCIPINKCPKDVGCNGDKNAVIKENVRSCQSTCDKPDVVICDTKVQLVGCVCKPGYILSKIGGKCVKPEQCPGGNPCGANGTYVNCAFDCPSNVCPQTDLRGVVACNPPKNCYPGCACKYGYVRAGPKDRRCIEPQYCKPVKCTGCNEVWDRCPQPCFSDNCEDVLYPKPVCQTFVKPVCSPRCVCAKRYGRDDNGVCVSLEECKEICS